MGCTVLCHDQRALELVRHRKMLAWYASQSLLLSLASPLHAACSTAGLQSDEELDEDDGTGKRKATMTEEDRKKRRQEINRQSARRIRERRTHEMENLRMQVGVAAAHGV